MKIKPSATANPRRGGGRKLPTLPRGTKVRKHPLPPCRDISTTATRQRIVYASTRAPFMSLVKRVVKLLDRDAGGARLSLATSLPPLPSQQSRHAPTTTKPAVAADAHRSRDNLNRNGAPLRKQQENKHTQQVSAEAAAHLDSDKRLHEVKLLASGRAIEKALEVAGWFARQAEFRVHIRSGTVAALDELLFPRGAARGNAGHRKSPHPNNEDTSTSNAKKMTATNVGEQAEEVDNMGDDSDIDQSNDSDKDDDNNDSDELAPYRTRSLTYIEKPSLQPKA